MKRVYDLWRFRIKLLFKYLCIYLTMLDLSCVMQDLWSLLGHGIFSWACELSVVAWGTKFFDQRLNLQSLSYWTTRKSIDSNTCYQSVSWANYFTSWLSGPSFENWGDNNSILVSPIHRGVMIKWEMSVAVCIFWNLSQNLLGTKAAVMGERPLTMWTLQISNCPYMNINKEGIYNKLASLVFQR